MIITQEAPKHEVLSTYRDKDPGPLHVLGTQRDVWPWHELLTRGYSVPVATYLCLVFLAGFAFHLIRGVAECGCESAVWARGVRRLGHSVTGRGFWNVIFPEPQFS